MPTGYTAKIIDGEVDNFKDFAKICLRAFGAAIHMRDESLDVEYKPREASDYYKERIDEIQKELDECRDKPAEYFLEKRKEAINDSLNYHNKALKETEDNKEKLENVLVGVEGWDPPTEEHKEFKNFMIQQIQDTLRFDGDPSYHKKEIDKLNSDMEKEINPEDLKKERIADLEADLSRAKAEHQKEVSNVDEANKWAKDLLESLK